MQCIRTLFCRLFTHAYVCGEVCGATKRRTEYARTTTNAFRIKSETILIDRRSKLSGQLFKIVADGCRAIDVLSTRDYAELDANI
jgi:hypothetical protein